MRQPARKWVPAKRRAVITRDDGIRHVLRDHRRPDGKAVAERFSRGEYVRVRRDGEGLVRPQLTGSGQATLDLVVDENRVDFVAAVSERLQERRSGYVDAAFTLNGFYYNTAGFLRNQVLDAGNVVVGPVAKSRNHWGEGFLVFGVGRRG